MVFFCNENSWDAVSILGEGERGAGIWGVVCLSAVVRLTVLLKSQAAS